MEYYGLCSAPASTNLQSSNRVNFGHSSGRGLPRGDTASRRSHDGGKILVFIHDENCRVPWHVKPIALLASAPRKEHSMTSEKGSLGQLWTTW